MRASGWNYSSDFFEEPNRDAVDGLSAIALALDEGLEPASSNVGGMFVDGLAILLGWAVLVSVLLYPALQLVAIGACSIFMLGRALLFPRSPRSVQRRSARQGITWQRA